MDDLVEAKVSVQVLLSYSVMLSEEPFDARAEMVDRAEPGFLFRYLRVHSYFLRYVQRSLIAVLGVMGDRAALVCYSVPRLSQLYSAWMPAADVLQDRFPCFVRPYSYGFLLAGYPAELLPSPDPSAQSAVSLVDLDGRARKDRLFRLFRSLRRRILRYLPAVFLLTPAALAESRTVLFRTREPANEMIPCCPIRPL